MTSPRPPQSSSNNRRNSASAAWEACRPSPNAARAAANTSCGISATTTPAPAATAIDARWRACGRPRWPEEGAELAGLAELAELARSSVPWLGAEVAEDGYAIQIYL